MTTRPAARKSRLSVSRADLAALALMCSGREAAANIRYGKRFDHAPHSIEVPDSAWHPATQLDRAYLGRKGGDTRGSAEDRRRRKLYLLNTWGDGFTVPCAFCGAPLMFSTLTVDRFPIPGRLGGRYTRDNIRPACAGCNKEDQGRAAMLAIRGVAA
jgi:hypothetical protein